MHEQTSSSPQRLVAIDPPRDEPLPLWASFASLGLGLGLALLAERTGAPLAKIALLSSAAATGGLGVFGVVERVLRARRSAAPEATVAFRRFYEASPEPIALVDATGRVRALNRVARGLVGDVKRATDLIGAGPGVASGSEADALVFRLLREALSDRQAEARAPAPRSADAASSPTSAEEAADGDAVAFCDIAVWPCGRGLAAWRWRSASSALDRDPLGAAATVAWFKADAEGRIVDASRRFREWVAPADDAALSAPDGRREPTDALAGALSGVDVRAVFPDASRRILSEARAASFARTRLRAVGRGPRSVSLLVAPLRDESGGWLGVVAPAARSEDAGGAGADALLEALDALNSQRLFEDAPIGVAVLATDGRILRLNPTAERLLAPSAEDQDGGALGRSLVELLAEDDREETVRRLAGADVVTAQTAADPRDFEARSFEARLADAADADGETRFGQFYVTRVDGPKAPLLLCYVVDASERRALEERFHQTQRLNAVGQLAGGVAHDFNNLLTVILAASELLRQRHAPDHPDFGDLDQIHQNARRAANLVGQLLAFSRKQTLRPEVVNLTEKLAALTHLLNRLIGEKYDLVHEFDDDLWDARVDVNQFEQVVTNLVLNAKDAMPDGGRITMRTRNDRIDAPSPYAAMPPGEFVRIEVEDAGTGIPKDKREKIFEPFFTTKRVGKGTGLGLSTVYGIVKQTGGYIFVDSEVGVGTVFTIFLRRHTATETRPEAATLDVETSDQSVLRARDQLAEIAAGKRSVEAPPARASEVQQSDDVEEPIDLSGVGRILLVEDEAPVRSLTARALRARGYEVLEAESGEDALELLEDGATHFDLLLSDVVMPNMDGPTLLRRISDQRPELRTLFMSGYARDAFSGAFEAELKGRTDYGFLQKPFSLDALARAVKTQMHR